MAILATDNFNRANANPLSGNWAIIPGVGALQIVSNAVETTTASAFNKELYSGFSWPNDQYSQDIITSMSTAGFEYIGVVVRMSSSADTCYLVVVGSSFDPTIYLQKDISGTRTTLTSTPYAFSPGDVIYLGVQGTTLHVKINGAIISALTTTDSSIVSGSAGLIAFSSGTPSDAIMGSWVGGDFLAPAPSSISPTSGAQGATISNFTVNGTHFDADGSSTISFSGSGITVNSYSSRSATQIVANITISAGAALSARDVIVTNPSDSQAGTLPAAFTVTGTPAPVSINPTTGTQGTSLNVTVSGTNFDLANGSTISFSGSGITVNSYSVQNGTTITANISISAGAAATTRDVIVTNPDGGATGTLSAAFTVTASAPPGNHYSVPDCRVPPYGPNASRNVQGTLTYDVQTSSNPAVPGVDSRVSKSADSRTPPNIPQNSRAPGTFGPGE